MHTGSLALSAAGLQEAGCSHNLPPVVQLLEEAGSSSKGQASVQQQGNIQVTTSASVTQQQPAPTRGERPYQQRASLPRLCLWLAFSACNEPPAQPVWV